jgi:hypothetical protein
MIKRASMRIKLSCRVDGYKERFYNKQYQSIRKGLILELFFMMIYFILQVQEMRAIKYMDGITVLDIYQSTYADGTYADAT